MPCQLQEKIEISVDIPSSQPHTACDQKYCVNKEGEICISNEFKEYLKQNYKIDQLLKRSEFKQNDLQWLLDKDPKIRKIFTSSDGYRLRFKENDRAGCDFIDKIFQFHRKPFTRQLMYDSKPLASFFNNNKIYQDLASTLYEQLWENDVLWGSSFQREIDIYNKYFSNLCDNARKMSVGDIYRLYDLSNKYDNNYHVRLPHFLALLYSLGYGDKNKREPESISDFVSHFEFFHQFSEDCEKMYELIAKKENSDNYRKRAILDNYVFLASNEGLKKAKEVWNLYYDNAQKLFGEGINFDESISDEEFLRSLKSHLACTSSPFPINFSALHSAAYHAFKHKDLCTISAEKHPICSYLEVIRDVVLNGSALPPRPDQFGKGKIFTFTHKCEIKDEKMNVKVYILKGQKRNTFILSCY